MPHQCLKCGSVFKDGSTAILRGCPECKGTRFFYTEKAMSEDERSRLKDQANKDIKYLIQEMLTGGGTKGKLDDQYLEKELFLKLKTEDVEKSEKGEEESTSSPEEQMERMQELMTKKTKFTKKGKEKKKKVKAEKEEEVPKEEKEVVQVESKKKKKKKKATKKSEPPKEKEDVVLIEPKKKKKKKDTVDVISISEKGVYEIDVERLMDDNPIIVQRDGSYLVHLPSVFEKAGKGGEEVS
jgi:predicted  nucleic acid-binding Zn-ribbon protein